MDSPSCYAHHTDPYSQFLHLEGWVFSWSPRCLCCFCVIREWFCVWSDLGARLQEEKERERKKKKEDSPYLLLFTGPRVSILWLERWAALGVFFCVPDCIVARSCPLSRQNREVKEIRSISPSSNFYFPPFFTGCCLLV